MQLSSDLILNHRLWKEADEKLCTEKKIFRRLVDIYVIACALGIKEDKAIFDDDLSEEEKSANAKTIGRNTHRENPDIRDLMDFMLQNALLNSKTIDFSRDERLRLAFDPDYYNKKINAQNFLTGFATYGIKKIFDALEKKSSLSVSISILQNDLHELFEEFAEQ